MSYFKYLHFLEPQDGAEFDALYEAGSLTPYSGIYYCKACGSSVTALYAQPLPAHDHHKHSELQGPIRWQLAVKSHYQ